MTPKHKILITGGAGSCGRYLTASLLSQGHEVRVIDKQVEPLQSIDDRNLTRIRAGVEDREILKSAVEGVDAVLHLAWSFSEDPLEVLEHDLKGHIYLLEEMASRKVSHLIYTSTAVVYGKPQYSPIDEKHPLVVEEARKPLYGIAKAAAEKLCLMYGKGKGSPATIVRFWWAYGEEIGGKHLREMLKIASAGEPLTVPAASGGSFLHMADLAQGLERCLFRPEAFGQTFNFSTVYVTWEEVAGMVRDVTGSNSEIRCIPRGEWEGSAFLADPWELSDAAARDLLGYRPMEASQAKASLKKAIAHCWKTMSRKS
ncbi:MAG: NAD(P)-dependent oxidoreductase [Deltaproteobacteria bacterium]|nr:NAD(P)-dependent oxidoreductase [Deltaproteobacteria bacterium]MDH3383052.1 NAD(P)-dependent oxidoreductase [Deltaproteobacteria bacterium]